MSDTDFSEQGDFAQSRPTKLRIANWLQEMIKGPEAAPPEPYRSDLALPLLPGGKRPGAEMAMDDGGAFPFQSYLGMGGQGAFNLFFPGYPYLAELQQRSEYRQPAETTAKEMVRKWIQFKSNSGGKDASKKISKLEERFEELDIQGLFKKALEHDAFFGLAHIFIDIKGQDGEDRANPLLIDKKTIAKGSLKGFRTIEPMWVTPIQWNATDPTAEDFYKPTAWFALNQRVHHTRLIQLVSRPLPDLLKPAYNFGGISLSQLIRPYVDRWLRTVDGVNRLINNFSIVYLQTDMSAMMQGEDGGGWTTEDQASLIARLRMFTRERDNQGIFVTDKNNEMLSALSVPLGGLEALQAQSQEHMAAPTHLPLVVLTGITPAGLNASSESELEVFHDWIHSNQELVVRRPLLDVLKIVQLDLFGEIDDSIGFEFVPLKQLDGEAASRVYKTKSEAGTAYIDAGVISAEEERQRLARDPDSGYINLDPDKLPEPPQEGPEGEGGPGGGEEPEGEEDEGSEKPKGAGAAHERLKKSDSDEDDGGEDEMPARYSGAWDEEWEESKHPRAANGQFGSGGGGASQSKGGGSSKGSSLPGGVEKLEANRPNPGVAEEVAQVNAKASIGAERRLKDYIERIGGKDAARARAQTEVGRKFASSAAETLVYGADIKEGTTVPVSVKEVSPEVGRGLFADAPIKKSGFIGEYIGDVKRLDPENMGDYAFWFPPRTGLEDYVIDASKAGNELRFANHSSDPNMDIRCVNSEGEWHVIFTAKRDISPGEQLTFDYGPAYWEKRKAPQELSGSGNDSAPTLGSDVWEESKHQRAKNGQFGKGGGAAAAKKKTAKKSPKKESPPPTVKTKEAGTSKSKAAKKTAKPPVASQMAKVASGAKSGASKNAVEALLNGAKPNPAKQAKPPENKTQEKKAPAKKKASVPAPSKQKPTGKAQKPPAAQLKPDSLGDMKKVGAKPGGSNPGAIYQDKDGTDWLVKGKQYPDDNIARNEALASRLIAEADPDGAPEMRLVDLNGTHGGGLGVKSRMLKDVKPFDPDNAEHVAAAQKSFALHAWLGNYDSVGTDFDNLVMKGGKAVNIDPGGALLYRAQGMPKKELDSGAGSWETMRDPKINSYSAKVYGGMSQSQLKESASRLKTFTNAKISSIVDALGPEGSVNGVDKNALKKILSDRRDAILKKAGVKSIVGDAAMDAEWEEHKHPRKSNGQFGTGGVPTAPPPKKKAVKKKAAKKEAPTEKAAPKKSAKKSAAPAVKPPVPAAVQPPKPEAPKPPTPAKKAELEATEMFKVMGRTATMHKAQYKIKDLEQQLGKAKTKKEQADIKGNIKHWQRIEGHAKKALEKKKKDQEKAAEKAAKEVAEKQKKAAKEQAEAAKKAASALAAAMKKSAKGVSKWKQPKPKIDPDRVKDAAQYIQQHKDKSPLQIMYKASSYGSGGMKPLHPAPSAADWKAAFAQEGISSPEIDAMPNEASRDAFLHHEKLNEELKLHTGQGHYAVKNYTYGSALINKSLDDNKPMQLSDKDRTNIEHLDRALTDPRNALSESTAVYSGVPETVAKKLLALQPGESVTMARYVSSSRDPDVANRFSGLTTGGRGVVMEIRLPKGYSNGRAVEDISEHKSEKEFILARGQSYRKVGVVEEHKVIYGKKKKYMRVILEPEPMVTAKSKAGAKTKSPASAPKWFPKPSAGAGGAYAGAM